MLSQEGDLHAHLWDVPEACCEHSRPLETANAFGSPGVPPPSTGQCTLVAKPQGPMSLGAHVLSPSRQGAPISCEIWGVRGPSEHFCRRLVQRLFLLGRKPAPPGSPGAQHGLLSLLVSFQPDHNPGCSLHRRTPPSVSPWIPRSNEGICGCSHVRKLETVLARPTWPIPPREAWTPAKGRSFPPWPPPPSSSAWVAGLGLGVPVPTCTGPSLL